MARQVARRSQKTSSKEIAEEQKIRRARIYYGDFSQVWEWLQRIYAKSEDDSVVRVAGRRAFFRNGLIAVLAQIEAVPECRTAMFDSLLDYASGAKSLDGLETVFLTLLGAANRIHDQTAFNKGMRVWAKFGSRPRVPGAGPMGFYNVGNRKMIFFSRETARSLRLGHVNAGRLVFGNNLSSQLEELAALTLVNPFAIGVTTVARRARLQEREGADNLTAKTWKDGFLAVGGTLVTVGVAVESFPLPEPTSKAAAAIAILVGLGIETAVEWNDFVDDIKALPSTDVEVQDAGQPPMDIPGGTPYVGDTPSDGGSGDGPAGTGIWDENGTPGDPVDQGGEDGGVESNGSGGGGCFTGETLVLMGDGSQKPIASIAVGDEVLGWRAKDRINLPSRVRALHKHRASEILQVTLGTGDKIFTTHSQRFSVNWGFLPARSLKSRTALDTSACSPRVEVMEVREQLCDNTVFNLSVDQTQTYFVGRDKLLVHNLKADGPEDPVLESED
jgi:hypothetical protein